MATVKAFIRTSSSKRKRRTNVAVRFRLCDGRAVQLFHTSEIMVDPILWDAKKECLIPKVQNNSMERIKIATMVADRKKLLLDLYGGVKDKQNLTSEAFETLIEKTLHPELYEVTEMEEDKKGFFDYFKEFLEVKNYMPSDKKNYMTMMRMLKRFELYMTVKSKE